MNKVIKPLHIIGLSLHTTNEEAFKENTIGKLWERFMQTPVKDILGQTISPNVFAVYSDYEAGYDGSYKITIGYAVNEESEIPDGLSLTTISPGRYTKFAAKSHAPEDIVEAWKTIWQMDPQQYQNKFITNFEEYSGEGVTVNIEYR